MVQYIIYLFYKNFCLEIMQFHISSPKKQGSLSLLSACNQAPGTSLPSQHPNDEQNDQQNKDMKKCQNMQSQAKTNNATNSNMNTNLENTHNITSSTLLPMYENKKYQDKSIQYQQLNRTITKLYEQKNNKPSRDKASGIKRLPLRTSTKPNITNTRDKMRYTECGRIDGNSFYKGPNICSIKQQKTQNKPIQIQTTKKSQQKKLKNNAQQIRKVKIQKQQNVINKWINIYDRVYKKLQIYKNNKLNIYKQKQNQKQIQKQKQKYKIEKQQAKEQFLKQQINIDGEFSVQYLIELLIIKRILLENPIFDSDAAQRIDWSSKLFKISKLIRWFTNIFKKPAKIKESNPNSSYKFIYPQNHHGSDYKVLNKTEKDIRRQNKIISIIKEKRQQLSPPPRNISYKNYSLNQNISLNNYKFDDKKKYKYYQYFKNQVFENLCQTFLKAKRPRESQVSLNQGKEKETNELVESKNKISLKSQISDKDSKLFKKCESLSLSSSSRCQMQFDQKKIQKQLVGLKKLVKKTLSTMSIHIGQDRQKIEKKLKRESLANYFNYKKLSKSVSQSIHKDKQKNIKIDNSYSHYMLNPMKVEFQRQRQLKKKRPKNFLKKRNGKYAIVIDKINKNKLNAKIKAKKQEIYQNSLPCQSQPKLISKNSFEQQSQQEQSIESSTVKIQLQQKSVKNLQEIYVKSSKRIKHAQAQSLIEDHKLTDEQIQKILTNAHHLTPGGQNQDQSNLGMLKMRRKYKKLMFSNKIKDKAAQDDTGEQIQGIRKSHRKKINNTMIGQSNQLTIDTYDKHSFSGFGRQKKNGTNDERRNNSLQKNKPKIRNKQFNSILKSYQTEEHQAQVQKRQNLLNQFYINQVLESMKKISNIQNISNIKNIESEDEKQQKKPQKQLRETFLKEKEKKEQLENKILSMKSEFQGMLKNKIQIDGPSVFCQIVRKKNNRLQSQLEEMARLRRPYYFNSGQSKIERNIDGKFQFQQDTVEMNFLKKFINQFGLLGQKDLDNKKSYKNRLFF